MVRATYQPYIVFATGNQSSFNEWLEWQPAAASDDAYVVSPIGQLIPLSLSMLRDQDVATTVINISQLEPRLVNYLDHHRVERFGEIVCKEIEVMAMLATENSYFKVDIALLGNSIGSISRCIIQLRYSDSTS